MEENTSKAYVGSAAGLLNEPPMAAGGNGSALFVINLSTSIAPVSIAGKSVPGFESYRLYQLARAEDGRTRHRLRLGFFTSEADAERVLAVVRESYPTAFTACLGDDDRKFTRGFLSNALTPGATGGWKRPVMVAVPSSAPPQAAKENAVLPRPKSAATSIPIPAPEASASAPTSTLPASTVVAEKSVVPAQSPVVECSWQPAPQPANKGKGAGAAAIAPQARSPAPAVPTAAKAITPTVSADAVEIELTWDPPALQTSLGKAPSAAAQSLTTTQTLAPVFKTGPVIKSGLPVSSVGKIPAPPAAPLSRSAVAGSNAKSKTATIIELALAFDPVAAPQAAAPLAAEPFHVGRGIELPNSSLSLQVETRAAAKKPATATQPVIAVTASAKSAPAVTSSSTASVAATKSPAAAVVVAASKGATAPPAVNNPPPRELIREPSKEPIKQPQVPTAAAVLQSLRTDESLPELDTTQTIRALTSAELNDDSQEKWFAIQLVASEQPVNLDAMPQLDIFEAYRLYSVASAASGKIMHSLRIGFFREEVSALAVSGYLKTFFPTPAVLRISTAEQLRFKDAPAPKASPAPAKGDAKVFAMDQARDRSSKTVIPVVTMEVASPRSDQATGQHRSLGADHSATGSHKINASGSFKVSASGSHRTLSPTLQAAAKSAGAVAKHSAPVTRNKSSATGRHKVLQQKSLREQLLDEARDVTLSESAIRKLPRNNSLLSRFVGKLKK